MPIIVATLLIVFLPRTVVGEDSRRQVLPADSYQILGIAGFRRLGVCNYTYAWLTPPPGSSLDAYGHALACARLQLNNGRLVNLRSADINEGPQELNNYKDSNSAEVELEKINKELTATMVNLSRLDALMRAVEIDYDDTGDLGFQYKPDKNTLLADDNRFFYLADRVGNLNIMAVLRPGQVRSKWIKFELIDPVSDGHALTPHHVLCSRKQCPNVPSNQETKVSQLNRMEQNATLHLTRTLDKTAKRKQDIYMQLIIARVVCALLSLLCMIFAITALILCTRLRRCQARCRKAIPPSETTVFCEPHPPTSYYHINGVGAMGATSPTHFSDNSQAGVVHLPSESASVKNALMSTSSISGCEGNYSGQMHYNPMVGQYVSIPPYSISDNHASRYSEAGGLITLVPIPSRASLVSNSRSILLPCQNGTSSPVPSSHSQNETASMIFRSESLGRHSRPSRCHSESGRRRLIIKPARQFNRIRPSEQLNHMLSTNIHLNNPKSKDSRVNGDHHIEATISHDWLSCNQVPKNTPSIHRFPNDIEPPKHKMVVAQCPINKTFTGVPVKQDELRNEATATVIRKPALST